MTTKQLLRYFKTQGAVARALGLSKQCVNNWFRRGRIPQWRQEKIEAVTRGKLKA